MKRNVLVRQAGALAAIMVNVCVQPLVARAAESDRDTAAEVARLSAEVARLQRELSEQKQLILNIMAAEQQRYDVLLQLIRSGSTGTAAPLPPGPQMPSSEAKAASSSDAAPVGRRASGKVAGQVTLPPGADAAYVYIDGLRTRAGQGKTLEIRQENKQFQPGVVAVPVGTRLIFPNKDAIFHNVFSKSRGNAFDLGSIKGGQVSSPVTLSRPGHVEIMCNIHSKMRADVLVVPNQFFARVGGDGRFELTDVPAGQRKVVVWGPGIKPEVKVVDVSGGLNQVQFSPAAASRRQHLNKFGQAYGSYDD